MYRLSSCLDAHALDSCLDHIIVRAPEAGGGVVAGGSLVAIGARVLVLSAVVGALNNVVEGLGVGRVDLVEERGDVAQDGLALGEPPGVEVGHQTGDDGGGGGGTIDGGDLATELDVVVVADGGDIGGSATRDIEVGSGRDRSGVLHVLKDDVVLELGPNSDIREAAAGGEANTEVTRSNNLVASEGALEGTTRGAGGGLEVGGLGAVEELGGANRDDVRAGRRESGAQAEALARGVSAAVSTGVARGSEEGEALGSGLGEELVDTLDEGARTILTVDGAARTDGGGDGALVELPPGVADGEDGGLGVHAGQRLQMRREKEKGEWNKVKAIL
jgi:hypothetical protein